MVVSLGALVAQWNHEQQVTDELIGLFINRLEDTVGEVCDEVTASLLRTQAWIHPFKEAIARLQSFPDRNSNDHLEAQKLFKLGTGHRSFLDYLLPGFPYSIGP